MTKEEKQKAVIDWLRANKVWHAFDGYHWHILTQVSGLRMYLSDDCFESDPKLFIKQAKEFLRLK